MSPRASLNVMPLLARTSGLKFGMDDAHKPVMSSTEDRFGIALGSRAPGFALWNSSAFAQPTFVRMGVVQRPFRGMPHVVPTVASKAASPMKVTVAPFSLIPSA